MSAQTAARPSPKPPWLKVRAPSGGAYNHLKETLRSLDLHTVCEEARCPNVGECWSHGTATVMLLGDVCTRGCRFCAVTTGNPRGAVDVREPEHVARAIAKLGLRYVVLTMVDRDDILDGGAAHVARTVTRLRELSPELCVEALVGDFAGIDDYVDVVADAMPDVFAHNIEVVERLQRSVRDARCGYARSLAVLQRAKRQRPSLVTKSSLMLGIGETDDEARATLRHLREADVDILTLGQYLRPTPKHAEVDRFVPPKTFDALADEARALGFRHVSSGPLVRSSYRASEAFVLGIVRGDARPAAVAADASAGLVPAERLVHRA